MIEERELRRLRDLFDEDLGKVFEKKTESFSEPLQELLWEVWLSARLRAQNEWEQTLGKAINEIVAGTDLAKAVTQLQANHVRFSEKLDQHDLKLNDPKKLVHQGVQLGALEFAGSGVMAWDQGSHYKVEITPTIEIDPDVGIQMNFPRPDMVATPSELEADPIQIALKERIRLLVNQYGDLMLWAAAQSNPKAHEYIPTYTHRDSGLMVGIDWDVRDRISTEVGCVMLTQGSNDMWTWEVPNVVSGPIPLDNGSLRIFVGDQAVPRSEFDEITGELHGQWHRVTAIKFHSRQVFGEEVMARYNVASEDHF